MTALIDTDMSSRHHADSLKRARAAKARAANIFAKFGEVVGIGITRIAGQYGLKVNLRAQPPVGSELPNVIDDVPVRVEVTGSITPR